MALAAIIRFIAAIPPDKNISHCGIFGFSFGTDLDNAEQKISAAINGIRAGLPDGVDPQVVAGSLDDFPIVAVSVTGKGGELPTDLDPRLAAVQDEPPRLEPAVVGNARGGCDHRGDLRITRRRLLEVGYRRRIAGQQEVDDRRRHGRKSPKALNFELKRAIGRSGGSGNGALCAG